MIYDKYTIYFETLFNTVNFAYLLRSIHSHYLNKKDQHTHTKYRLSTLNSPASRLYNNLAFCNDALI